MARTQQIAGTFQDRSLTCVDCGNDFVWTAKDQDFFQRKGFQQPKRCKDCRTKKQQASA